MSIKCIILGFVLCLLNGCYWGTIYNNCQNIQQLKVGMSKQEVLTIMGSPIDGEGKFSSNPNVWYYQVKDEYWDGHASRDECEPLCFDAKTEKLKGWGYEYYKNNVLFGDWKKHQREEIEEINL